MNDNLYEEKGSLPSEEAPTEPHAVDASEPHTQAADSAASAEQAQVARKKSAKKKKLKVSGTLYDYLFWRGDIGFDEMPPNEVDNLIFSMLIYIAFDGIISDTHIRPATLLTATKKYLREQNGRATSIGLVIPKEVNLLLVSAAKTARFGLCKPFCYVNKICDEEKTQFCAVSFMLPSGDTFVAFRGTDDTLVGWRENFSMSYMHPVPAHLHALQYLEHIASVTTGKLYLGGHSKGGNLAVYSAVKSTPQTKQRIAAVYSNDGPGFNLDFFEGEEYASIRERIHKLVPQSSIIGTLLEHSDSRTVIKSRVMGLYQHNGLSWEVKGGSFVHLESTDEESQSIESSLREWLASIEQSERQSFVDSLFEAFDAVNIKTLTEMNTDKLGLLRAYSSLSPEARGHLIDCINAVKGKKTKQQRLSEKKEI